MVFGRRVERRNDHSESLEPAQCRALFNFGGRAYNSTQELILLQLYPPQRLNHIVVLSGVNNALLTCLTKSNSPVFNSFFCQSEFREALMSKSADARKPAWRGPLVRARKRPPREASSDTSKRVTAT